MKSPALLSLLLLLAACGEKDTVTDDSAGGDDSAATDDSGASDDTGTAGGDSGATDDSGGADDSGASDDTGAATPDNTCGEAFDEVTTLYPDAGELVACSGEGISADLEASLLNLDGVEIELRGTTLEPCVELRCDADYAYVFSNNLQHYDGVFGVPVVAEETRMIYRVPLQPEAIADGTRADALDDYRDCEGAYDQLMAFPDTATTYEPGGYCNQGDGRRDYLTLDDGSTAARTSCFGTNGFVSSGLWVVGSTEATNPDPYGNPGFFMPYVGGGDYQVSGTNPVLDLCGGHGHHHGVNPECFERDGDGRAAKTYDEVEASFDLETFVEGAACAEEGDVVGWAVDGVPLMGPCACMARSGDGACTELKRVRSGFVYEGLARWGEDSGEEAALGQEGESCESSDDCTDDSMVCAIPLVDAPRDDDLTRANKQCVLIDYASCTHEFMDRSEADLSGSDVVYADACNGVETADGYRYFVTGGWPHVPLCLRYEPSDTLGGGLLDGR